MTGHGVKLLAADEFDRALQRCCSDRGPFPSLKRLDIEVSRGQGEKLIANCGEGDQALGMRTSPCRFWSESNSTRRIRKTQG